MSKITLTDISHPGDATVVVAVNNNNTAIEQAFDNTLSRDGTAPNQMEASLDMNSHRVLNLPAPLSPTEPARLQDVTGNVTLNPIPAGGSTNQVLTKSSNVDYDVIWAAASAVGSALPLMNGTATVGVATAASREDHVHPTDTTRAAVTAIREKLTGARTYYVRTDGNDSNTGLVDNAGGAFRNLQKAVDTVASLDMSTFQATIQMRAGTYTTSTSLRSYLGTLPPIIIGDTTTPANIFLSITGASVITADGTPPWDIRGVKIQTTGAIGIDASNNASVYFRSVDFGTTGAGGYHMRSWKSAVITPAGNYTISGGADGHYLAGYLGAIVPTSITITITGTPAFASAFATAAVGGILYTSGSTYSGSATGARYSATLNGVIMTSGGGANYFPGNAAGSTGTGGQYA